MKKFIAFTFLATFAFACSSNHLKSSAVKGVGPLKSNIPYANYVNYYGYISKSVKPDGIYRGKKAYYLYFWVPAVIDEVGVSMYSPADKKPGKKDFKHAEFDAGMAKDPSKFFDTYLVLEKLKIFSPGQIKNGGAVMSVLKINDDSSEMPKNPKGRKLNSLLRHKSDTGNPAKALVRGVYRITFTSFRGNVEGSYIATVGTNIPGVKIAASLKELHKLVNEK